MGLTMDVVLQRARPVLPVLVIEDCALAVDLARALYAGGVEVLGSLRLGMPRAKDAPGVQSADAATPGTADPATAPGSSGVRPF